MAYKNNIPQPSDILATSQDDLLKNFQAIPNVIDPNQFSVIMPNISAPLVNAGFIGLYAKTNPASGLNELYFKRNSAAGTDGVPITGGVSSITGPVPQFIISPLGFVNQTPVSCGWTRLANGAWKKYGRWTKVGPFGGGGQQYTIDLNLIGPTYQSKIYDLHFYGIFSDYAHSSAPVSVTTVSTTSIAVFYQSSASALTDVFFSVIGE